MEKQKEQFRISRLSKNCIMCLKSFLAVLRHKATRIGGTIGNALATSESGKNE